MSVPITISQEHLKVLQNWSFLCYSFFQFQCFLHFWMSVVFCFMQNFAIPDKSISILLAPLNWEWSKLCFQKKNFFCLNPLGKNNFLQNRCLTVFQKLILLFFFVFRYGLLLLVQISFHEFSFFCLSFKC